MTYESGPGDQFLEGDSADKLLPPEAESRDHFTNDLANFEASIEALKERELRVPAIEIPANYEILENVPENPLDWTHALATALSSHGFDIRFSSDAYMLGKNRYPVGNPLDRAVGVHINASQFWQAWDLATLSFDEGGVRHNILPAMTGGRIDYTYLNPENSELKYLVKTISRDQESYLKNYYTERRQKWGYVPPSDDEEDYRPRTYTVQELFSTGLIKRAFLTSRLFASLPEENHGLTEFPVSNTEADRALYETFREQGLTPFRPEEIYGLAAGVINDVQHRYPGLRLEKSKDEEDL